MRGGLTIRCPTARRRGKNSNNSCAGLDLDQRVPSGIQGYGLAVSTTHPPTHDREPAASCDLAMPGRNSSCFVQRHGSSFNGLAVRAPDNPGAHLPVRIAFAIRINGFQVVTERADNKRRKTAPPRSPGKEKPRFQTGQPGFSLLPGGTVLVCLPELCPSRLHHGPTFMVERNIKRADAICGRAQSPLSG